MDAKLDTKKFAEVLKSERFKRQMTQEQFANFVGVTKQAISYYENGERTPRYLTAWKIANKLGISIESLAGDAEVPPPSVNVKSFILNENEKKQLELILLLQKHADAIELMEKLSPDQYSQMMNFLRFLSGNADNQ